MSVYVFKLKMNISQLLDFLIFKYWYWYLPGFSKDAS